MQELQLTGMRFAKIFWLVLWRISVLSLLIGGVIAFLFGKPLDRLLGANTGAILGSVLWIPISALVLWTALRKTYRNFRIVIVELPRESRIRSHMR